MTEEPEQQKWSELDYEEWNEALPEIIESRPERPNFNGKPDSLLKFRHKSCGTTTNMKKRFPTEDECAVYILEMQSVMHPYLCRFCGFWHMGHGDTDYGDRGQKAKAGKRKGKK